jgi:hypothetical protein
MNLFLRFSAVAVAVALSGCAPMQHQRTGQASPWDGPTGAVQRAAGSVYETAPTVSGYGGQQRGQPGYYGQQQPAYGGQPGYGQPQPAYRGQPDYGQQRPAYGGQAGAIPPSLVDLLVGQFGISSQQAIGGAGAIFSLAQQRMSPANFAKVSNAVPGMDHYLASVPRQNGTPSGGLLGAAAAVLMGGQGNTSSGGLADVGNAFQGLGLNSGMVSQFIPVLLQYIQSQGGNAVMNLLQSALY